MLEMIVKWMHSHEVQEILAMIRHCLATDAKFLIIALSAVGLAKVISMIEQRELLEPAELVVLKLLALGILIIESLLMFGIPG